MFIGFREKERNISVRETSTGCGPHVHPNRGLNLQPRNVSDSKPQPFGVQGDAFERAYMINHFLLHLYSQAKFNETRLIFTNKLVSD